MSGAAAWSQLGLGSGLGLAHLSDTRYRMTRLCDDDESKREPSFAGSVSTFAASAAASCDIEAW